MEQANLDGYYVGITVVFGYSFLVASFVLVLVAEKENKVFAWDSYVHYLLPFTHTIHIWVCYMIYVYNFKQVITLCK